MSRGGGKGPGDDGGFAGRWSRMKQAEKAPGAEQEAVAPEAALPAEAAPDGRPDAEILEELGLPEPESLKPGDDFSAFMAKAVPERIRNRALRRLWVSDPVLANVDGLVDYGGDFTDAAMVVENLQTLYKAGRGYFDRMAEVEGEAGAEAGEGSETGEQAAETAETDAAARPEAPPELAAAGRKPVLEPAPEAPVWPEAAVSSATQPGARPRSRARMRFRMAED